MTDRETIDVYQREAQVYASLPLDADQIAALDRFIAAVGPGGQVLDVGCGPGLHAESMLRAGLRVDALDPTPAFVTEALHRGINARLGTFDDIASGALYDGIHASFSLLHAPRADLPRHIGDIAGSLRPGGVAYVGMKVGAGEARDRIGRLYTYVSELELTGLLRAAGLRPTWSKTGNGTGLSGEVSAYILMLAERDHG